MFFTEFIFLKKLWVNFNVKGLILNVEHRADTLNASNFKWKQIDVSIQRNGNKFYFQVYSSFKKLPKIEFLN